MLIWIEHEVWVLDQQRSLIKAMWTPRPAEHYNEYKDIEPWLSVAYDKEYYQTQYEVKFRGFVPTVENIAKVSDYFGMLYWKNDTIQNKWPDFVGTHIHLFNSYWPNNKGLIQVVERVFREMAGFWMKYYADDRIAHLYKMYELKRLSTSNNLLKFLDHNVFAGHLKIILDHNCQQYQYKDIGMDRPKYCPVIWSPSRGWKEYSLELRYISNTYYLLEDPVVIKQLVDDCEEIVRNATINPNPSIEFHSQLISNIYKHYLTITTLSYGIQNNMSLRDVEARIRELISLVSATANQDRLRLISQVNLSMISDSDLFARSNTLRQGERRNTEPDNWDEDPFWEPGDDDSDSDTEEGS